MHGITRRRATHAPAALAVIAAALTVGACSKGEQDSKARPNAPIEAAVTHNMAPTGDASVDAALKERLARQEAASKMFESKVLVPPPPKSAEPKPPAEVPKVPEPPTAPSKPAPAAAAPVEASKAEPPKTAPPKAAAEPAKATASTPPPDAPRAAPPKAPPKTDVALAKPSAAPSPVMRLVSRVEPDFPPEAYRAGVDRGTVKARMTVDAAGGVTNVEIVEANPRRVFDRAVSRALAQWKFNEGAPGRTYESEIEFKR